MKKEIFTIWYEIPGMSKNYIDFNSKKSLMDADILLISPKALRPNWDWVNFSSGGGGCYNVATSDEYKQNLSRFKKEVEDFLNSGKNIFILLSKKEDYLLANNVSHPKKGENLYSTDTYNNYDFLPINLGKIISASGKHIEFSGNVILNDFYKKFNKYLEYQLYIEDTKEAQIIFTGKDKSKTLGAIYNGGKSGYIIALPFIKYDEDKFIKYDKRTQKSFWTDDAVKFWHNLTDCLIQIDQQLTQKSEKTPTPEWITEKDFFTKRAISIKKEIQNNEQTIENLKLKNLQLKEDLIEENSLQDLLFEQWKPLENAVIKALNILWFQAENYDDGILELDQVIISPEGHRFIGECEGKDNKDIDITKFRQLLESLSADFGREEIEEKAFGILFGNPQRLEPLEKRVLDFTQKCKIWAKREKIALVRTTDLFVVAQYLNEHKNEKYKKDCRNAIYNSLGEIVEFPKISKQ